MYDPRSYPSTCLMRMQSISVGGERDERVAEQDPAGHRRLRGGGSGDPAAVTLSEKGGAEKLHLATSNTTRPPSTPRRAFR